MIFTSQQNKRMVYENAYSLLSSTKGVSKTALDNAVLTQSFIRLIQPLAINQSIFSFPVLNNQQGSGTAVRPDEQRLNLQDAAFVYAISMYIAKASSTTATNWIPETYPNVIVFPTGASSLYQVYNGKMIVNINNSTIVPAARNLQWLNIPQTQQTAALGTGISQDQFDGTALPPWEPNIVFAGLYNTVIDIKLPGAMTAVDATTLCIIECECILAQNVCLGAAM
jgi:hypothetical protein